MKRHSKVTILAGLLAGLFTATAFAQEAPPTGSCMTLLDVETQLQSDKQKFVVLNSQSLIGVSADGLGAIVITTLSGQIQIGFEIGGCMSEPQALGKIEVQG